MAASWLLAAGFFLHAQDDPKQRAKIVRELSKGGSDSIPKIEPYLSDPVLDVRLEAVKAIAYIGTQRSLDPLIKATNDNDAEIQIRAIDGLVNFYFPGYASSGLGASFRRIGTSIKNKFTDTNDQVIDAFIQVRPEVVRALGRVARGGATMESRANAARGSSSPPGERRSNARPTPSYCAAGCPLRPGSPGTHPSCRRCHSPRTRPRVPPSSRLSWR